MSTRGAAPGAPLIDHVEPINDYLADWRAESLGRILRDCSRAVRRYVQGVNKLDRDALAQDAACHILKWEWSGDDDGKYRFHVGASGAAPSREMWRSRDDWREPSNAAWVVMHRAIRAGLEAPAKLGWRIDRRVDENGDAIPDAAPVESPMDPTELDRVREARGAVEMAPSLLQVGADHAANENAANGEYSPIPDDISVRALADAGEIPLRAARALAYQSLGMSPEDAARAWGMTIGSAKVAVSDGAAWIRDTYPETGDLAAMLRRTARAIRDDRLERAMEATYDYLYAAPGDITDGDGADIPRDTLRREAIHAITEWRESSRTALPAIVALEVATRRAYWRAGRRLKYVEDGADIAGAVRRAVESARREEYRRMSAPHAAPLYGAPIVPAPFPVPRSPIVAAWLHTFPRARPETATEREARHVRETAPATSYAPTITPTRRAVDRITTGADRAAQDVAFWEAREAIYRRCAPGSSGHAIVREGLREARRRAR